MHAHAFIPQERTLAPSQILRGVAGPCAPAKGLAASCLASDRVDSRYSPARTGFGGRSWSVDFGSLTEGGPV